VYEYVNSALTFLKVNQFVLQLRKAGNECGNEIHGIGGVHLCSSPLGKATVASGMSPTDAVDVLPSLFQARSKLILSSQLHILYLLTPCNYSGIHENWIQYDHILTTLIQEYPQTQFVVEALGIDRSFLDQCKFSTPNPQLTITKICKRFFLTMIIFVLLQEWPLSKMKQLFQHISRGQTQVLLKDTTIFASMMKAFCDKLNWKSLSTSFTESINRLSSGSHFAVLTKISDDLTLARARVLWIHNIRNAEELMCCSVQQLADLFYSHLPYLGNYFSNQTSENLTESEEMSKIFSSCQFSYQSCVALAERLLVR
jgi:DNA polymerase theta